MSILVRIALYSLKMGLATGLAIFSMKMWQVPSEKGKSHGTCPFLNKEMASPMGLANFTTKNGKSNGTCPFQNYEMASPMGLATPITTQFSLSRDALKMASPIGLAIFKVSVFGW